MPVTAGLLLLSCSANRMYRPLSVESHPDYTLAFVEFDDQGELWAPSQLERALAILERLNRSEAGMILTVFIHGWNSNASPREERAEKGSIYQFRKLLVQFKRSSADAEVPVFGIYLGWRGRVSKVPLLRELSFYNRRGAAERIAGASATEAMYRILTGLRSNPLSRSVLIGHSFGSMILERALAQSMVSALLAAPGSELIFPADLVVLFNPAGSATDAKQLVDILVRNRFKTYRIDDKGKRYERPLLVSFTSEKDAATRFFFPMGMSVKAVSKKFRSYGEEHCSAISNQRWLYTHTAGHTSALHSHVVTVGPKAARGSTALATEERFTQLGYHTEYDPRTQQVTFSFDGSRHRFTIKRKALARNDTPYWIMQVPRELIPNHSQVFTEDTLALIEAVAALSGALERETATVVVREDGVRPVAVVPRPDGSALFLDRSRAIYAVDRDAPRPLFISCLREAVEPSDAIGFHVAGHLAYAALAIPAGGGPGSSCRTEVYEFEVGNLGYRQLGRFQIAGADCFSAAAFDVSGKRAFFSSAGEDGPVLLVADLTKPSPKPVKFVSLPGTRPATVLYFDAAGRRLFAARGTSGELWVVEPDGEHQELRLVAGDLGWPTALGYGKRTNRLYLTDSKLRRIWALDCSDGCGEPSLFLESEALENPSTLAVALDGTLWLGDLEAQTLLAISPEGRIENTIHSLSGYPLSPATRWDRKSPGDAGPR